MPRRLQACLYVAPILNDALEISRVSGSEFVADFLTQIESAGSWSSMRCANISPNTDFTITAKTERDGIGAIVIIQPNQSNRLIIDQRTSVGRALISSRFVDVIRQGMIGEALGSRIFHALTQRPAYVVSDAFDRPGDQGLTFEFPVQFERLRD